MLTHGKCFWKKECYLILLINKYENKDHFSYGFDNHAVGLSVQCKGRSTFS
ncbi:hypothetical protein SPHINGO8BC_50722 [Sphingobacterium multivorum]|uniref:Uncharacterized protein n=1 Tax=Sphingobacterium multivorum TaxID=28454 RepID=A0A654C897_SPHMU|nr:hypothetical protein SPHINGO8BC_50722 [Sphingobacterium multivorum]